MHGPFIKILGGGADIITDPVTRDPVPEGTPGPPGSTPLLTAECRYSILSRSSYSYVYITGSVKKKRAELDMLRIIMFLPHGASNSAVLL